MYWHGLSMVYVRSRHTNTHNTGLRRPHHTDLMFMTRWLKLKILSWTTNSHTIEIVIVRASLCFFT